MALHLNPCPFCGSREVHFEKRIIQKKEACYVICNNQNCWAFGPIRETSSQAQVAWNDTTGLAGSRTPEHDYRRGYQHGYANAIEDVERYGVEATKNHCDNEIPKFREDLGMPIPPIITAKGFRGFFRKTPKHLQGETDEQA